MAHGGASATVDTPASPAVSICVPSVRPDFLPHLVESVLNQTATRWELIVGAQGTDERLYSYLARLSATDNRITYIRLDRRGRSIAMNAAAAKARAPIIAFTDDDCTVEQSWIQTIIESFNAQPDVGIVAGDLVPSIRPRVRISACPATRTMACVYHPRHHGFRGPEGFYWGGANFAVRREILDLVGPFDEFLGAGTAFPSAEDTDFCIRAEMLDVGMWTRPDLRVHHTFGRRYGLMAVLKHYRGYGLGSGALGAKLKSWDHRLWYEWSRPRKPKEVGSELLRKPLSEVRRLYYAHYAKLGTALYLRDFEVDERRLTRPKLKRDLFRSEPPLTTK